MTRTSPTNWHDPRDPDFWARERLNADNLRDWQRSTATTGVPEAAPPALTHPSPGTSGTTAAAISDAPAAGVQRPAPPLPTQVGRGRSNNPRSAPVIPASARRTRAAMAASFGSRGEPDQERTSTSSTPSLTGTAAVAAAQPRLEGWEENELRLAWGDR